MVIDQTQVRQLICKYGKYVRKEGRKSIYGVKCQACGKDILSSDPGDLDAALGKRGNLTVWHSKCGAAKVWKTGIK